MSKNRHMTPAGGPSPLDAVRQLLSERAKFEKWLSDLEAKKETTPKHVFDRVKGDYSGRLQGVLDKLKEHSSAMSQHAATLTRKLEQLTESEQGILDSRAESELRAEVGELSQVDWDRISKKLEKDLAKIKQDQQLVSSDLNDLRELLGAFDAQAPAPGSTPPAAPTAPTDQAPAPAAAQGNVDELAFLKSVIGTTPAEPASVADQPVAEAPKPATPPARPSGEKLVETPPPGPVIRPKTGGEEPLAMHVTGSNPIVLRSSGVVEQPKTLKCAECNAMNYPSEWYCERCGAELTTV